MHRFIVGGVLLWGFSLVGCSSSSDDPPKGRGSDACHQWQSALCSWVSKCGGSAEQVSACNKQAAAVTCKSDELANSCVTQLKSGSCAPPLGCDLRDLADSAPAVAACNDYLDAVCTSVARCGGNKTDCLADPALSTLCTNAIGYTLAYEQCIAQVKTVACSASALPAVCMGVILK